MPSLAAVATDLHLDPCPVEVNAAIWAAPNTTSMLIAVLKGDLQSPAFGDPHAFHPHEEREILLDQKERYYAQATGGQDGRVRALARLCADVGQAVPTAAPGRLPI